MEILRVVGIIIEIVVLFNFIILVHELGHFLAARWRGLRVDKFQIWFGKPLWSKTVNGVQYGLGWIPAGGFVALPQMAPMEMLEGRVEDAASLKPVKPIDKIIVAAAGPLFSFLLAVVFALLVWKIGHPVSKSAATTTIGYVRPDATEEARQLQPGDKITAVDGKPVDRWHGMVDSVQWNVLSSHDATIPFQVERPGVPESFVVDIPAPEIYDPSTGVPEPTTLTGKARAAIGKFFTRPGLRMAEDMGFGPSVEPMIDSVWEHSPAAEAGLRSGDVILKSNGEPVRHYTDISRPIQESPDHTINLTILRNAGRKDEKTVDVTLTARIPDNQKALLVALVLSHTNTFAVGPSLTGNLPLALAAPDFLAKTEPLTPSPMIGVKWNLTGRTELRYSTPTEQIQDSVETMYNTLSSIFSPDSNISAKHLAGPVGISRVYYILFQDENGWRRAIWFSVLLNINLGIMNLLPLPVLDGGHITMALIEWIRRRPLSVRLLEFVQAGCALFLIGFMIFITGFDLGDVLGGGERVQTNPLANPMFLPDSGSNP